MWSLNNKKGLFSSSILWNASLHSSVEGGKKVLLAAEFGTSPRQRILRQPESPPWALLADAILPHHADDGRGEGGGGEEEETRVEKMRRLMGAKR